MQGSVTWFNSGRGYGFLKADDGKEFFVHFSGINGDGFKSLVEGQQVEFDIEDTERGPKAINITVLDNKPNQKGVKKDGK